MCKDESLTLNGKLPPTPQCVCVCVKALTAAVGCVWGSSEAAHQDCHSPGCGLYSAQDKMLHLSMCYRPHLTTAIV